MKHNFKLISSVASHLIYALLAWGTANKGTLDPVIKKQKNAIRLISNARYNSHTEPLLKKAEILKFEDLYKATQIEFMHSLLLDKLPSSFESTWYRNRVNKPDGLRNSNQIYVLYARLVFTERLPLHSFPKTYNNLISPSLKGKLSMDSFKESLMDYFINEYKEIIYCGRPYCKDCFPNQM